MVETVDSMKLAKILNDEWVKKRQTQQEELSQKRLKVLLQILTSDEGTKHGISPDHTFDHIDYIAKECPGLRFCGLMSMGKVGDQQGFKVMRDLKHAILQQEQYRQLFDENQEFILSMGTSQDYLQAIEFGAN
jgi:uncharacterized pyridoxal phosphate-containing UPF0001 family protein